MCRGGDQASGRQHRSLESATRGGEFPAAVRATCDTIGKSGGTPLVVPAAAARSDLSGRALSKVVAREWFAERRMGIKTVMITGDNPMTAAAIAAEAGVDDFLAEATPRGQSSTLLIRN